MVTGYQIKTFPYSTLKLLIPIKLLNNKYSKRIFIDFVDDPIIPQRKYKVNEITNMRKLPNYDIKCNVIDR